MVLDETTSSLVPADLFIQPGDQPPIVTEDLTPQMLTLYRKIGIFAHEEPVRRVASRVQKIDPAWIHPMHGGSFKRELAPSFYQALREQELAYDGMLRGRELPIEAHAAY